MLSSEWHHFANRFISWANVLNVYNVIHCHIRPSHIHNIIPLLAIFKHSWSTFSYLITHNTYNTFDTRLFLETNFQLNGNHLNQNSYFFTFCESLLVSEIIFLFYIKYLYQKWISILYWNRLHFSFNWIKYQNICISPIELTLSYLSWV